MRPVPCATSVALLSTLLSAQSFDWRQSPFNGRLYAVTQPLTWAQARSQANLLGGNLATVRNSQEHDWLYQQFGNSQCLWIGYSDAAVEGSWIWVSGSTSPYTNWAVGEPNNTGGVEDFAAISPRQGLPNGRDGAWIDLGPTVACPGIIELELDAIGRARVFGQGCPGTNGNPTLTPLAASPVPGSQFPVRFGQLPNVATVGLASLGLPRSTPLDLGQFGLPGCEWWVNNLAIYFPPLTATTATWSFMVPASPTLRGVVTRLQSGIVDPGANAAGVSVTNAITMTFGSVVDEVTFEEPFLSDAMLDRDLSGGSWTGGSAEFAAIGGDGRHGTFDPEAIGNFQGVINGKRTFFISTDNTIVPATNTLSGQPLAVTDGRFYFDGFTVAADIRLVFQGQSPPVITVAGRIELLGEIDIAGESTPYPSAAPFVGQEGGMGGVFAGSGGKGADRADGLGVQPRFHGQDGESAHVLASRAYANTTTGTGGSGSLMFPASGLTASILFAPSPTAVSYSPTAAAGGGGGGLHIPGEPGRVVTNNHIDPMTGRAPRLSEMGPPAAGGLAVRFLPFPAPTGSTKSSVHYLVGGSGGGGSGSHAALALDVVPNFTRGAGGGGGGGAIALRAGGDLDVHVDAGILAHGGSTGGITAAFGTAAPAPAGGGSGGSIVLQADGDANVQGAVDVRGGTGGYYNRFAGGAPPIGAAVEIDGGDGSPGFIRLETAGGATTAMLPNATPAATPTNVGTLNETDELSSMTSRVFDTRVRPPFQPAPRYLRYEIEATVDGNPVTFSDDPAVSTVRADVGSAVQLWVQGSSPSQPGAEFPWRSSVRSSPGVIGLDTDAPPAFRFRLVADYSLGTAIRVARVRMIYGL
ncbi:MAG: hypothetical protein NXI31_08675 [bacterium]|nr:hypothetical protein [bacterium]